MALMLQVEQDILAVKLDKLYLQHKAVWIELAVQTFVHIRKNYPKGASVRPDDVAEGMKQFLMVNDILKNYLAQKKLKPKYWFKYFADFVTDRGWNEIEKEAAKR